MSSYKVPDRVDVAGDNLPMAYATRTRKRGAVIVKIWQV